MALYLLRHADSTPAQDIPEPDWPLSPLGKEQAESLISVLTDLQIEIIYSSPYLRALATVDPFASNKSIKVIEDQRLQEKKLTDQWLDNHAKAIKKSWADFDFCYPDGESNRDCQQRIIQAINEIKSRDSENNILISSHGNAIGLYLNSIDSHFNFQQWSTMKRPHIFKVADKKWTTVPLQESS